MLKMMVGLVGIRLAGAILNLLSQLIFARLYSPEDVGIIFLAMSTAAFFGLLGTVGYPWLALTLVPRFETLGTVRIQRAFHGAFLRDGLKAIFLICGIAILVYFFGPQGHAIHLALLFGCLAMPASMLMRYDSSIANSQRKFSLSYMPDFLLRPILLLAYILVLEFSGIDVSVIHALLAFVVCLHLVNLVQAYLLGKDGALHSDFVNANPKVTRILRPRALSLAVVALVATSFTDVITLVAGLLLPSHDVAAVSVAIRLAAMAGFIIQVAQQFILPDLTAALTKRDHSIAHRLLLRLNLMTIGTIAAALIGAFFLGHFVLSFFGQSYMQAWSLLMLFLIGQSIRAFSGMNQQLLSIAGFQARTAWSCLVALVFLVAGSIYAVNHFGVIGIGYAVIIAEIGWSIMLAAQAKSLTGKRGDIFWLLQHSA